METDQLRLNEMAYLHVPDKERSKSPSPADSLASSATDISTLPIHDRSLHRGDGEHVSAHCRVLADLFLRGSHPRKDGGSQARLVRRSRTTVSAFTKWSPTIAAYTDPTNAPCVQSSVRICLSRVYSERSRPNKSEQGQAVVVAYRREL